VQAKLDDRRVWIEVCYSPDEDEWYWNLVRRDGSECASSPGAYGHHTKEAAVRSARRTADCDRWQVQGLL